MKLQNKIFKTKINNCEVFIEKDKTELLVNIYSGNFADFRIYPANIPVQRFFQELDLYTDSVQEFLLA